MKYAMGFLIAYTLLVTLYAHALHNGKVASINQACVQYQTPETDLISELKRGMK
jgi:hypothetical protein